MGGLATLAASKGLTLGSLAARSGYSSDLLLRVDQRRQALPRIVAEAIATTLELDVATVNVAAGAIVDSTNALILVPRPPRTELGDEVPLMAGAPQPVPIPRPQTRAATLWVAGSFGAVSVDLSSLMVGPRVPLTGMAAARSIVADIPATSVWPFDYIAIDGVTKFGRLSVMQRTGAFFLGPDGLEHVLDCTMGPAGMSLWVADELGLAALNRTTTNILLRTTLNPGDGDYAGVGCGASDDAVFVAGTRAGNTKLFVLVPGTFELSASSAMTGTSLGGGLATDDAFIYVAAGTKVFASLISDPLTLSEWVNVATDYPTISALGEVFVAHGFVWVTGLSNTNVPLVFKYTTTGDFIAVANLSTETTIGRLAADDARLWAVDVGTQSVLSFDPSTLDLVDTIDLSSLGTPYCAAVMP